MNKRQNKEIIRCGYYDKLWVVYSYFSLIVVRYCTALFINTFNLIFVALNITYTQWLKNTSGIFWIFDLKSFKFLWKQRNKIVSTSVRSWSIISDNRIHFSWHFSLFDNWRIVVIVNLVCFQHSRNIASSWILWWTWRCLHQKRSNCQNQQ